MGILITVLSGFVIALPMPWLHRRSSSGTGWALAALPFALAVYLFGWIPQVADEGAVRVVYPWVPGLDVQLSFLIDGLSLFFALLVCVVGAAVFVYSGPYIKDHEHAGRFYSYMLAFMASMLGLVLADNVFALYVFFELTSVSSFLLISFKYDEAASRRSAWQALLVTTGGGFALMAGLILLGDVAGTFEVSRMLEEASAVRASALYLPILLLVLAGAFTKSAQFPFHFWLPNAMAAPSPVSAYLHSATMVKAGVYLLARLSPVLGGTAAWVTIVTVVGAVTMLLGAYLALCYTELKRILAYSTIMALGTLTMLLGVGGEKAVLGCMAFVLAHALYKAPLFMVAGTLEHEAGSYDVAKLGGLARALPATFAAAVLAALGMAGFAPFIGYLGKEAILTALTEWTVRPMLLSGAAVLANAAVIAVAGIASIGPFVGHQRHPAEKVHRAPAGLWVGPVVLAGIGLIAGLVPGFLSEYLIGPAVAAVEQAPVAEHLVLWHGFTAAFFLSLATIALGVGIYASRTWLRGTAGMRVLASWFADAPDRAYDRVLDGVKRIAGLQTRILQHGYLHHYVAAAIGFGVVLIGYTVAREVSVGPLNVTSDVLAYEAAAGVLLLISATAVVVANQRFTAVLALSSFGFLLAVVYLLYSAPDAALVQLLVETLTLILVVLALVDMPRVYREPGPPRWRIRNLMIALGAGTVVALMTLSVLNVPFNNTVGEFYLSASRAGEGGRNVVNNILVDFRALDTLGEITVLVVAGLSAYALMHRGRAVPAPDSRGRNAEANAPAGRNRSSGPGDRETPKGDGEGDAATGDTGAPNGDGGAPMADGGAPNGDGGAPNGDGGARKGDGGARKGGAGASKGNGDTSHGNGESA